MNLEIKEHFRDRDNSINEFKRSIERVLNEKLKIVEEEQNHFIQTYEMFKSSINSTINDQFNIWKEEQKRMINGFQTSTLNNEKEIVSNKNETLNDSAIFWSNKENYLKSIMRRLQLLSYCFESSNHYELFISDVNLQCKCILEELKKINCDELILKYNSDHKVEGIGNIESTLNDLKKANNKLYTYLTTEENKVRIEKDNIKKKDSKKISDYLDILEIISNIIFSINPPTLKDAPRNIEITQDTLKRIIGIYNKW